MKNRISKTVWMMPIQAKYKIHTEDVSAETDVVALEITEFLPWDIIRLSSGLAGLDIFAK